jgi:hypothetical protein
MATTATTKTSSANTNTDKITYEQAREEIKNMSIVEEIGITAKAVIALASMGTTQLYRGTRNWEF